MLFIISRQCLQINAQHGIQDSHSFPNQLLPLTYHMYVSSSRRGHSLRVALRAQTKIHQTPLGPPQSVTPQPSAR